MYTKLEIKGTLEVITGMHIGGSSAFAAIGAVDSPVVRDTLSDLPVSPGSSLKGKIRTLLAKRINPSPLTKTEDDDYRIQRLFGSSKKDNIKFSRLIFSDLIMNNMDELRKIGLNGATEVKFENTINRISAVANPRQIERVIRGAQFPFTVIYNVDNEDEVAEDIRLFATGLKLLTYDYLGGHGSRGYGKVEFSGLTVSVAVGQIDEKIITECQKKLEEV